jgi:hypothetical protein
MPTDRLTAQRAHAAHVTHRFGTTSCTLLLRAAHSTEPRTTACSRACASMRLVFGACGRARSCNSAHVQHSETCGDAQGNMLQQLCPHSAPLSLQRSIDSQCAPQRSLGGARHGAREARA